jgi:hypothetical protein
MISCLVVDVADRQAVNENGETFIDDVSEGDVWFFPPYVQVRPHTFNGQIC